MKSIEDTCFLVVAKSNSERTPGKMYKEFCDSSLLEIAINKLIKSKKIPNRQICISVHGDQLIEIANKYKDIVRVHIRDDSSVQENSKISEIYQVVGVLRDSHFVEINACCPLLQISTIERFVDKFISSQSAALFGVIGNRTFYWDKDMNPLKECSTALETKRANIIYEAAHTLYAGSCDDLKDNIHMGSFTKLGDPELYVIDDHMQCWDIDYPWQFVAAEELYKRSMKGYINGGI